MEMTQLNAELSSHSVDRSRSPAVIRLTDLTQGTAARVVAVSAADVTAVDRTGADSSGAGELGRRLAELGFLPGEKLKIVARGFLGREPIAVRIGTSTFALRLFEAACIRVCPEPSLQA
jgi:ferrous iron transport protein A